MSKGCKIFLAVLTVVVALGIGVIIGYFSHSAVTSTATTYSEDTTISRKLMDEVKSKNIRENLRFLTTKPHIAGSEQDETVLVNEIVRRWRDEDLLDSVVVKPYDVLLSYPVQNDSNYVAILSSAGDESDISQRKELVLDEEQNDPDVVDPFNAYSATGKPEGDLVYVNYGTIDDFMHINRSVGIDLSGKICIARYGSIFRGDKAEHATDFGCSGLILYSDPIDYTVSWAGVYPDDWYLPPTGAQRGTLMTENGDPRTPNYPSISSAWHQPNESLPVMKIPVTPIGYVDAVKYLEKLRGQEVTEDWRGGLNITYRYGPGFDDPYTESKMKMSVQTRNEARTVRNVIGYIRGSVEPDRYVLLGNHRDAWVFGAIDPSSGTAAFLELVRGFGVMLRSGWRPRRTIVFCSWAAEEYGLIGSTEWVEDMQKELGARAVVYLNVDSSVTGNFTFRANGVHSIRDAIFAATKLVQNPNVEEVKEGRTTVYDTWLHRYADLEQPDLPWFASLGSGSDYTPFLQVLGIPATDMRYIYDYRIGIKSYPVYHSVYETFELVSKYLDPDFQLHLALTRVWGEVGRKFADAVVLPFDIRIYTTGLQKNRKEMYDAYGADMEAHGIDFAQLDDVIEDFSNAADEIQQRAENIDQTNLMELRQLNDQLMQLERAFIDQNPLPGRTTYRHVITAPSVHNSYGSSGFPAITDALFDIDTDPDQAGSWDEVRRQFSIVIFHIMSAANTLRDVIPA